MRLWLLLLVAVGQLWAGAAFAQQDSGYPERASLIALIANPSAYEGRLVSVDGYLTLGFEDSGLYVGRADYDQALFKNALWVDSRLWNDRREALRLSRHYVSVEGVFTAKEHGHMGAYSGLIKLTKPPRLLPSRKDWAISEKLQSRIPLWTYFLGLSVLALLAIAVAGLWHQRRQER